MMEDDYLEEKRIGKVQNIGLLRRLLTYIKPYKFLFLLAAIITLFTAIFDISLPYITKIAIDQCLIPSYAELKFSGKDPFFEDSIRERYKEYFHPLKENVYLIDLSILKKRIKLTLKQRDTFQRKDF